MLRSVFSAIAAFVMLAGVSFAADPAPAPADAVSPARMELARELVQINGSLDMLDFEKIADSAKKIMPAMLGILSDKLGGEMTDEAKAGFQSGASDALANPEVRKMYQLMQKEFEAARPALIDQIAVIYAKRFSEQELETMLAFYRTDAGKHLVNDAQEIQMEAAIVLMPIMFDAIAKMAKEKGGDEGKKHK